VLTLTVFLNGLPYAWTAPALDTPTGSLDTVNFDGTTLAATGQAFLNEAQDVNLGPFIPIPESEWIPFTINVSCDQ